MPDAPWPRLGCSQLLGRSAARLHLPSKHSASSSPPPPAPVWLGAAALAGPPPREPLPQDPAAGTHPDTPPAAALYRVPGRRPLPPPAPHLCAGCSLAARVLLSSPGFCAVSPLSQVTLCPCSPTHTEAAPAPDWPTPSVPDSPFCSSRPSRADARERDFTPGASSSLGNCWEEQTKRRWCRLQNKHLNS